jgi:hypothetical protein
MWLGLGMTLGGYAFGIVDAAKRGAQLERAYEGRGSRIQNRACPLGRRRFSDDPGALGGLDGRGRLRWQGARGVGQVCSAAQTAKSYDPGAPCR